MPLPVPNIDDWSYQELVDEGVRLIPAYAPEWTNYNAADPGITLLELFAYFTEQLIYQAGQLSERDLRSFYALLRSKDDETVDELEPETTIEDALRATVLSLRRPSRAVTPADYELQARLADPRVARARCLQRLNLAERSQAARMAQRPGHVSVVLVPRVPMEPVAMDGLLSAVSTYLEPRRVLTTRVHVVPARYLAFSVRLQVSAMAGIAAEVAAAEAARAITSFFDPLIGGSEQTGWSFGRPIFLSDLYEVVARVSSINYVTHAVDPQTGREIEELAPAADAPERVARNARGELMALMLEPDELPGKIDIAVSATATSMDQNRQV